MKPSAPATALVALALGLALPALAQTDPAIQAIRDRGVSENRAAESLVRADGEADAAAERGEQPEPETPVAPTPLPQGRTEVGSVQTDTAPLEPDEEPDPEGDAEDAALD